MPLPAKATDFLYDSEAWIVEPCSIDIRFAAVSVKDGDPHRIIAAAIAVHPFPLMDSDAYVFNLEAGNYWFGQQHLHDLDQEAVRKVLEEACNGRIEVYGKTVELPPSMLHNRINVPNDSFNYALRLEVSAHTITPTGQYEHLFSRMQSFTLLDDILRRSNPPFDGIEDILRWLDLREGLSDVGPSRLRISVGTPIDISGDGTKLNDGTLQISIVAHPTVDVSDISLAVNGVPSKGIAQRLQIAGELQWNEPKDAKRIGSATIAMPGVDSVQVMLSLSTRYVRRHWFVDPIRSRNERYLSMRLFDSNLKMVRRYLFDETNADKFELSVAALLYLSGFNPAVQVETDSPDILVSTPSGQLALVECTIKIADVERKIGKLVDRREALTKALSTEGRVVQVLSVLACQSDRAQIAATDRELAMKGILLFSKEDLARQVETRLHAPINPDIQYQELIDRLKQFSAPP